MSAQTEARVRMAGAILLLVAATAAAPVVNEAVWFLSEAPYVPYLPLILERGAGLTDALATAAEALRGVCEGRLPL
jgi:hypothetical protein